MLSDEKNNYREKAESYLKAKKIKEELVKSSNFEKIAHELAVHQIELEMQNEDLKNAEEQLRKSRDKYFTLYDFSPIGYLTFDENGLIIEANQAAADLLGVNKTYMIKKPFMIYLSHDSQEEFINHRKSVFELNKKQKTHLKIINKNSEKLNIQIESIKIKEEDNIYCLSAVINVEHLIVLNQKFKKAKEEAERLSQIKTQFISNISHELRTPMNAIIGFTKLTLENDDLNDDNKENLNLVIKSAEHLTALIKDLLDVSKIEANKLILEKEKFNIKHLIKEIFEIMKIQDKEKNLNFILDIDEKIPDILYGDKKRISEIYLNLISNAIKFTEEGHVKISTKLLKEEDNKVFLNGCIEDSGIGIEDEKKHLLFKNFSQIESTYNKKYSGTGLGLAITKKIIEKMGGNIKIESLFGKGTKFIFEIPLKKE
jgi:hypothetical protein